MASCEGVDAAGVLLPHAERDNAMRAAALMDSNFLFMLFYPFGVQFGHHEFIIFTRYRFSLLPKTNLRCIIGNTNKCSIFGRASYDSERTTVYPSCAWAGRSADHAGRNKDYSLRWFASSTRSAASCSASGAERKSLSSSASSAERPASSSEGAFFMSEFPRM